MSKLLDLIKKIGESHHHRLLRPIEFLQGRRDNQFKIMRSDFLDEGCRHGGIDRNDVLGFDSLRLATDLLPLA